MEMKYAIALFITFLAGMSTLLGGFMTFFIKRDNLKALSIGLGFSAGVMIYLSLTEILQSAKEMLSLSFAGHSTDVIVFFSFFAGIFIAVLIDYFMPDHIETDLFSSHEACDHKCHRIRRAGLLTALAVAIHNFPEGIATFLVSSHDLSIGIPVALAIAIHNIPEGIAVALPIYHAGGKKRQAIFYSFLSGIAEPVGGLLGLFLLKTILPEYAIGVMYGAVAGIMVYISFDTLLPLAREYGEEHHVIIGIVSGMFLIALGLLFL